MNSASTEDDLAQGQLIKQILVAAGHQCVVFSTGNDLLAALQQKEASFALLLIDWELPDIDGIDIVRWVRANLGQAIPIMFLTSRTQEEDLVVGLWAGADDYMTKPLREGELLARVEALQRRYQTESHSEAAFR